MLARAGLAIKVADILRRRRLTQLQGAALLGVDQPKVSALIRGRLSGFSIDRLLRSLLRLGTDVSITIKPHSRPRSKSCTRTAMHPGKVPAQGILTVYEIVADRASKSAGKQRTA